MPRPSWKAVAYLMVLLAGMLSAIAGYTAIEQHFRWLANVFEQDHVLEIIGASATWCFYQIKKTITRYRET